MPIKEKKKFIQSKPTHKSNLLKNKPSKKKKVVKTRVSKKKTSSKRVGEGKINPLVNWDIREVVIKNCLGERENNSNFFTNQFYRKR